MRNMPSHRDQACDPAMTERVYTTTRLGAGDYLLPSNDAQTLWRLRSYLEDGSAEDYRGRKLTGTFWHIFRWHGENFPTDDELMAALTAEFDLGIGSDEFWGEISAGFRTRRAAMKEALSRG